MEQLTMFESAIPFPQNYDDIDNLYQNFIFDGELDEQRFSFKETKTGRSYFFYGIKVFSFSPDSGKGPKLKIIERNEDKPVEIPVSPQDFPEALKKLKQKYRFLVRNTITETFACCNDFKRCSAVDTCIHQKEIFYNGCQYRRNLEAGRNFYKASLSVEDSNAFDNVIGLDFETANSSRSSACAVAAVKYDFSWNEIARYETLINPHQPFDVFNIMIHGITESDVAFAPDIDEAMAHVFSLIEPKSIIVCHNSAFDMSVLRHSLGMKPIDIPDFSFACTYRIAASVLPKNISYSLPDVADQCGVGADLVHHNAGSDASTCAKIFLHLVNQFGGLDKLLTFANLKLGHFTDGEYDGIHKTIREKLSSSEKSYRYQYSVNPESPFYEKTVVFTGKLESMTRDEAFHIIQSIGGYPSNTLNKTTDYLITGYQDPRVLLGKEKSSKRIAAEKLLADGHNIEIIAEEDFIKML